MKRILSLALFLLLNACSNPSADRSLVDRVDSGNGGSLGGGGAQDLGGQTLPMGGALKDATESLKELPKTGDTKTDSAVADSIETLSSYAGSADDLIAASQARRTSEATRLARQLESLQAALGPLASRLDEAGLNAYAAFLRSLYDRHQVWRMYNPSVQRHAYVTDPLVGVQNLGPGGYYLEGVGFQLYKNPGPDRVGLKECVNANNGCVFLSTDPNCEGLATNDWGILGYAVTRPPDARHFPLYRGWLPSNNDILSSIWDVELHHMAALGFQLVFHGVWVPSY